MNRPLVERGTGERENTYCSKNVLISPESHRFFFLHSIVITLIHLVWLAAVESLNKRNVCITLESHYKQTLENNLSKVSSFHCLHSMELKNPEILSNMITNEKFI